MQNTFNERKWILVLCSKWLVHVEVCYSAEVIDFLLMIKNNNDRDEFPSLLFNHFYHHLEKGSSSERNDVYLSSIIEDDHKNKQIY